MQTITIDLPDTLRTSRQAATGVPYVTTRLTVLLSIDPTYPYLLVRDMQGLNDSDVQGILESCEDVEINAAIALCGGCLVDLRATTLPSTDRLYLD